MKVTPELANELLGADEEDTVDVSSLPLPSRRSTDVELTVARQRAFTGKTVKLSKKLLDRETGAIGEAVAIAYLTRAGYVNVRKARGGNFALDLVADGIGVEVKSGLISNSKGAQHWRLTIGEPSDSEKEFLAGADVDVKAEHNLAKKMAIVDRKQLALSTLREELGMPIAPKTVTVILDPDRQLADVFEFDDWHSRIAWTGGQATRGFRGSYHYAPVQAVQAYREKLKAAIALGNPHRAEGGRFGSEGDSGGSVTVTDAVRKSGFDVSPEKLKTIADTATKLGFDPGKVKIDTLPGDEREVGGRKFTAAALYRPTTGEVILNASSTFYSDRDKIAAVVAHEVTHDAFHKTYGAWQGGNPDNRPDETHEFVGFLRRNYSDLQQKDGVTEYSKAYWKATEDEDADDDMFDLAVNETLAEISKLQSKGQLDTVSPVWKEAHSKLMAAYQAEKKQGPDARP